MSYYILGNLVTIFLNIIHIGFYFDVRDKKWLRMTLAVVVMLLPYAVPAIRETEMTDYRWPAQVALYAVFVGAVFHYVAYRGGFVRIMFGVLAVGSFANINLLLNNALFIHFLGWPNEPHTFWAIRIGQLVFCMATYPLLYVYVRGLFRDLLGRIDPQDWRVLVFPFFIYTTGFMILGCAFISHSSLTLLLSLVAIGTIIAFHWNMFRYVIQRERNRFLSDMVESFNKLLPFYELYSAELDKKERTIRAIRHDLRKVLGGLTLAARDGDMDSLVSIVKGVAEMEDRLVAHNYTDNKPINGVVSFYFSVASNNGAACSARLALPEPAGIPDAELVMLFGNALENCVKATRPLGGKGRIDVSAGHVKDCLVVKAVNNYMPGSPVRSDGLGIHSMRILCEKFDGRLDVDAGDGEFRLTAILKRGLGQGEEP